ncbi:ligase-associated DNA damage response DEXH box helicase [Ochrobactrum sp. GRS2]|nr:ligase-associated DNA damage response DEXH box helicase [Ochrobactrum sp. GRS2]
MKPISAADKSSGQDVLPAVFVQWFADKGWQLRQHQRELLERSLAGQSTLLIAPTGAGKTLAGFLPALTDLTLRAQSGVRNQPRRSGIHTLYISPLKALAVDIERNLAKPVAEMALPVTIETRTGDTPAYKRQRQKLVPPDILLTTPEQLALLLAGKDAADFFTDLRFIIFDELHALVTSKRGQLLALGLARLRNLAPQMQTIGLSATVAEPDDLRRWLVAQGDTPELAGLVTVQGGAKPEISILQSGERIPWAGHSAGYALGDVYELIRQFRTTLIFVNTRSQAERIFQELWRINELTLPIGLHHGSLDATQRRRVEEAMSRNALRAVVATSTLDLGIDWGDVDLVIHIGAPKGASRLAQRIGRSNHRMDEPSRAVLVPANRFEVLECNAALVANVEGVQDTPPLADGALDVLAQHILGMACAEPFHADVLYAEICSAAPYQHLSRHQFDRVLDFVATGGYALRVYERFAKIRPMPDGRWRVSNGKVAQQYRLNIGTIVEAPELNIRMIRKGRKLAGSAASPMRGGQILGRIEEYFLETLTQGDTFFFAGQTVRFEGIRDNECLVSQASGEDAKVPVYAGGKFPLSTYLASEVRAMLADDKSWQQLPDQVRDWLQLQRDRSLLPAQNELLVETFPRQNRFYMVCYPFEGRLAHQTLGMLLTRRLDRAGARPLGFVATDYSLGLWAARDLNAMMEGGELSLDALFDQDMLGDDLEAWLDESYLLKRTFRNCALISGMIERRHPGKEKTGRQLTISTDLIYDVLRSHEPDHILLQATRAEAAAGLLDIARLGTMLQRVRDHIVHRNLPHISPLALPVMLEIGKERVAGTDDDLLEDMTREALEN